MENHRFISSLRTLNSKAFKSFARFINTDYFNKKEEVKILVKHLKKEYPHFTGKHIEKSYVLVRIFPEYQSNHRFLDDLLYNANRLLEQFLVLEEFNENNSLYAKALSQSYRRRELFDQSLKVIDKRKKGNQVEASMDELYYNFDTDFNRYFLDPSSYKRDAIEALETANLSLDVFYWASKLWINDELESRKEVVEDASLIITKEDADKIKEVLTKSPNAILQILFFLNFPDEGKSFEEILSVFNENITGFNKKMNAKLVIGLINYCKKQYAAKQDMLFLNEWFKLYKLAYDHDLLTKDNRVNDTTYLNIVHLGLIQKEHTWIRHYIKGSEKYLSDTQLSNLANAMLNYDEKKYEDVIKDLNEVSFGHIHQNLTARSLLAKACYELKEFDLLENHLKAFEIYLRRQKDISEALKEANLNFIKSVRRLVKVPYDKKMASILENDLDAKSIAYKLWLKEKLLN